MMAALYVEDAATFDGMSSAHFERTIERFLSHPETGAIARLWDDASLAGYALLVPYWSNEFGGTITFIDELYVKPEYRSRGLASAFIDFVFATQPFGMVACLLETTKSNERARRLYERNGFQLRENRLLFRPCTQLIRG